jgi:ribose/xylose/arabinose/galactoside ABC-type transport system permease subunit
MKLSKKNIKEPYIKVHVLEGKTWYKDYILVLAIAALVIVFSVMNPKFIGIQNIFSIFRYASILGFIALGMNIILILDNLDLSSAAITNFVSLISVTFLMNNITNLPLIWIASILVGVMLSFLNVIFAIYIKAPLFIITLGMSTILSGVFRIMTHGGGVMYPKSLPPGFTVLGKYDLGHLFPVSVIMLIIAAVLIMLIVEYSPLGRKMYAIGSNPNVAKHVGIEVNKVKIYGFFIAGLLYGIAGIMTSSMYGSAIVSVSAGYLFPAIISVLLGTSFLSLRIPNIKGTLVSVILLSVLVNGFTMINLPFYFRDIVQGIILIFAIGALG